MNLCNRNEFSAIKTGMLGYVGSDRLDEVVESFMIVSGAVSL